MFKGDVRGASVFLYRVICACNPLQTVVIVADTIVTFNRFAYRHTEMQGMEKYGLYQADKNWSWHHFEHRYYRPRVNL